MNETMTIAVDAAHVELAVERVTDFFSPVRLGAWLKNDVAEWFQTRARARFDSEGDTASGRWQPLTFSTRQIRKSKGFSPSHPINQRTRALYAFVTNSKGDFSPTLDGGTLLWPGAVTGARETERKFEVAQQGTDDNPMFANAAPTPARPVVAWDETDLVGIMLSMTSGLERHVATGGGLL